MLTEDEKVFEIQIPCDCHTEKMMIHRFDKDEDDYFYVSFWADTFYTNQETAWWRFKDRLKTAWKVLRKGSFPFQEMIWTREKIEELRNNLTELLEKEKSDESI